MWTRERPTPGGLIPACAGSTVDCEKEVAGVGAHPRLCGEHFCALIPLAGLWGSSPPVRGARLLDFFDLAGEGLIPACAGSTLFRGSMMSPSGAHPRLCGEHTC